MSRFSSVVSGNDPQMIRDLNTAQIATDGSATRSLRDYGLFAKGVGVEVVFRNIEERLIEMIGDAEIVVGCVAWLTSPSILAALAERTGIAIIVQKEDFLRPDLQPTKGWPGQLRSMYERLPGLCRYGFDGVLGEMSVASDPSLAPVRCLGNRNNGPVTSSRAHNKFVVFCKSQGRESEDQWYDMVEPYAVWTGSFNFTQAAGRSLENAVVLHHPDIAEAYLNEFCQLAALSEPLDWSSPWVEPEWRIGT